MLEDDREQLFDYLAQAEESDLQHDTEAPQSEIDKLCAYIDAQPKVSQEENGLSASECQSMAHTLTRMLLDLLKGKEDLNVNVSTAEICGCKMVMFHVVCSIPEYGMIMATASISFRGLHVVKREILLTRIAAQLYHELSSRH